VQVTLQRKGAIPAFSFWKLLG